MAMPGFDTAGSGYSGQAGQYAAPSYGQSGGYNSGSPGATAPAYGQAQFHDYRGSSQMQPYQPASSGGAAYQSSGGAYANPYGSGDTSAPPGPTYTPAAPSAGSFGAQAGFPPTYGQGAQFGAAGSAPAPGSFGAGSYGGGGYGGYQDGFNPLPPSGSFVATQGGGFDAGMGGVGPMGQFSNPFLAAMYSTLNGQTDPKNWPQFDVPAPHMPLAAAVRAEPTYAADRGYAAERGEDTADPDRKKILDPKEKEEKKKRGTKKDKEQPSGFWFWTCS